MKDLERDPCHSWDKLGLFILAGLVVLVIGGIVAGTYVTKAVPDKGDVLIGGISTGLILFLRDLVGAVRGSWEEVTRGKTNEALSKASPTTEVPPDAEAAAQRVAEAATREAEQMKP